MGQVTVVNTGKAFSSTPALGSGSGSAANGANHATDVSEITPLVGSGDGGREPDFAGSHKSFLKVLGKRVIRKQQLAAAAAIHPNTETLEILQTDHDEEVEYEAAWTLTL